ncbi:MAG TPA: hypothetical protein VJB99_01855 [Patescibacteria group bacterium]|nr:hypothetical protein [Patescibacteria group bacterium]
MGEDQKGLVDLNNRVVEMTREGKTFMGVVRSNAEGVVFLSTVDEENGRLVRLALSLTRWDLREVSTPYVGLGGLLWKRAAQDVVWIGEPVLKILDLGKNQEFLFALVERSCQMEEAGRLSDNGHSDRNAIIALLSEPSLGKKLLETHDDTLIPWDDLFRRVILSEATTPAKKIALLDEWGGVEEIVLADFKDPDELCSFLRRLEGSMDGDEISAEATTVVIERLIELRATDQLTNLLEEQTLETELGREIIRLLVLRAPERVVEWFRGRNQLFPTNLPRLALEMQILRAFLSGPSSKKAIGWVVTLFDSFIATSTNDEGDQRIRLAEQILLSAPDRLFIEELALENPAWRTWIIQNASLADERLERIIRQCSDQEDLLDALRAMHSRATRHRVAKEFRKAIPREARKEFGLSWWWPW